MSDERSVEARFLSLLSLSLTGNLVDPISDSSYSTDVVVPEYITAALQSAAEFAPNFELRRLAGLALTISKRHQAGNFSFNSLALEVCTSVRDAISGSFPVSYLHPLTRLLDDIETFSSRNSYYHVDQVQEYRRRLGCILDDASEEITSSSTGFQMWGEEPLSARRTRYPPARITTTGTAYYPESSPFSEAAETTGPRPSTCTFFTQIYWCFLFIYHIVLLRLPTTFHSLASDGSSFLQDGATSELDSESWDNFTEILLKQWKTLGLLSTLIFGATLTMFQIPTIADNSLLRIIAHCALLCVMMSLIYTSLLSVYFGSWRNNCGAVRWMQEMRTANPYTFWNFWVMISLPAVWTCWGIFLFLASMILFVWPLSRYDSSSSAEGFQESSLGPRVFLMMVVVTGGVHLALAISKLRRVSNCNLVSGAVDVGSLV